MFVFHYIIYLCKQALIARSYLIRELFDKEEISKLIRTKLFTLQMIDYIALCYIIEALASKNIVQIGLYTYMLLYSIIMDVIIVYVNYKFNFQNQEVFLYLVLHTFTTLIEILWTISETKFFQEEFSLRYFRRFGASTELNRAYSIREDLKICSRFLVFSQYLTVVHYFLGVYIHNTTVVILMFISQAQLAILNASFVIFKKQEIKRVRQLQIMSLLVGIGLRICQLLVALTHSVEVDRYNFYSIFGVEMIILVIATFVSYIDYTNFGKGLAQKFK